MVANVQDGDHEEGNSATTIRTGQHIPLRSRALASPRIKRHDGSRLFFCNSRVSSISFNVISIITDIIGFIIISTKPGNLIDLTISDRTVDIVLSLFLLCSLSGIIGAIFYETLWVAIPRFAYVLKAFLAGLAGVFVVNVVSSTGHDIAPTVIISLLGKGEDSFFGRFVFRIFSR